MIDAYALTLAAFLLTAGSAADRIGRRKVFVFGLTVFTLSSLACGLAGSPIALIVSRGFQGVGGAVLFATSLALLAEEFEGRQRGTAFGIWGATIGGAVAVGPLVGGVLTEGLGWEWIFLVNLPVGLAAIALTLARVPESRDPAARSIDVPGVITFSSALFCLIFAVVRGNAEGWGSTLIVSLFVASVVLLVRLRRRRGRGSKEPMLDLSLFRKPAFAGASIVAFGLSCVDVLDVPLPHALPAGRAGARPAGHRPLLPASVGDLVLRRPAGRAASPRSSRSGCSSGPG